MNTNNPTEVNGIIYDMVCVDICISSVINDGKMTCSANMRSKPYKKDSEGNYIDSGIMDRTFMSPDLFNEKDKDAQKCIGGINALLQEFVLAKKL